MLIIIVTLFIAFNASKPTTTINKKVQSGSRCRISSHFNLAFAAFGGKASLYTRFAYFSYDLYLCLFCRVEIKGKPSLKRF